MARRKSKGKTINPTYYVFCEGKTEEEYVKFLKKIYRIPIEVKHKVEGNKISYRKVREFLKGKPSSTKDKVFLMYDLDVEGIVKKLDEIDIGIQITSNPSIELWFLLHYKNQTANISSGNSLLQLQRHWSNYEKGVLRDNHKQELISRIKTAISYAKNLKHPNNPSSKLFLLIEALEEAKSNKI